jgi:hypothetical protein
VRAFIAAASTYLGNDQSVAGQDGYAVNQPRQYQTIGPGGLVGVEGTSLSNGQKSVALTASPLVLLLIAGMVGYFVLKHQ